LIIACIPSIAASTPCNNPRVTPIPNSQRRTALSILLTVIGLAGVITCLVLLISAFQALAAAGDAAALHGIDAALGFPPALPGLALFAAVTAWGVGRLGSRTAVDDTAAGGKPVVLGSFLIVAGTIGFIAAWELSVDKVIAFVTPDAALGCDVSVVVQCTRNLLSPQGSVLGFPNPLIGIGCWIAPIAVGIALLCRVRFRRWYWIAFNIGVLGAAVLVFWLIGQSILVLGTLCIWCMVTWSVTIPTFWAVTLYNLKTGNIPVPRGARRFFEPAYGWVPLLTFVCYVIIAVMAQLRLDVIHHL
jgi:uncharacterized membrane protein